MGTLWSTFRQLQERTSRSHMVAQRRASSSDVVQQPGDQPESVQIVHPEQSQLLLPMSATQTGVENHAQQESSEAEPKVTTQADLAHKTHTNAQQPELTLIPGPNGANTHDKRKEIEHVTFQMWIDGSSMTKVARLACSGLMTVLAHFGQRKSRPPEQTGQVRDAWKCIGTSAVGTKHSKTGAPCQDAWKYRSLPSGELVIAVADGAGSASLAQEGATLAVAVAVNYLCMAIPIYQPNTLKAWTELITYAFEIARVRLITHAVRQETSVRHYATTLQIVVLSNEWTVTGIIGDGIAVGLANDTFMNIMIPQHYEYANVTNFITSSSAMRYLDVHVRPGPVEGVAILTDGLLPLSINEQNNLPHPKFFEPLFRFLGASTDEDQATKSLEQFLNSSRVNTHTDDDKTLVLALRMAL